jgi:MFS family permease
MASTVLQSNTSNEERMSLREKGALLVLCGAIFLEGLDIAMLNVALPHIRADLDLSTTVLSAVVSAYVIGYAGFMLLGGRIADLYGRRRVFLAALTVFLLLSGFGGLATHGWMLLVARFITGLAAAFMTPAGLALITTNFDEGPRRNKAILIYAGAASAGYSLGLVAGGVLTGISWRWVFFAPVMLSAVILLLAVRLIRDRVATPERSSFDAIGAVLMTAAMLSAAVGIARLEQLQQVHIALGALALSAVLCIFFVRAERLSGEPLIPLSIFRSNPLVRANVSMLLFGASFFGFQFLVTLYLQELLGWTPLQTGLALIAVSIDAILAPTLTPRLVRRFGSVRVIVSGLALAALAYALFVRLDLNWTYAAMLPTMLLLGLAFALAYGPLTIVATNGVAASEQGLASSLVNTSFQFGAALGLSGVSALSMARVGIDYGRDEYLTALRTAMLLPVVAAAIAAGVMGLRARKDTAPCTHPTCESASG